MKTCFDKYDFPSDLKEMSINQLNNLSQEIRSFLVSEVSKTGGHLASNLGIVELTLAMHKVFDSPSDKFIWDVGHQCYVHKILTNRANQFDKLRQFQGLSGFPKAKESEHDAFDTGHSTTSLSAAFGIAKARDLKGENNQVIAVIGDGSLTGGMAYEALNNIGSSKTKMIVILNDNGMSISKNTGSVSKHLVNLRTSSSYLSTKSFMKRVGNKNSIGRAFAGGLKSLRDNLKYSMLSEGGVLFEELGFTYFGPVDGHNMKEIIESLERAKKLDEPVIIHVITEKGKGYLPAEKEPNKFHGVGSFDIATGELLSNSNKPSYSKVMGDYAVRLAQKDKSIVAITAAMGEATGLGPFQKQFPNRFFDVGIAEQHAVTFAAGLAKNGMKPLVCIYSSFLQRSYDQIIIDVCMQNLPVVFAIDRAGIVGADGETHHGIFDISYLSTIPNLTVLAPKDGKQLEQCLDYAFSINKPVAIRYPRGEAQGSILDNSEFFSGENHTYSISEGLDGPCINILAVGTSFSDAFEIGQSLKNKSYNVDLTNVVNISEMHKKENNKSYDLYVTIEDGEITGGYGQQFKAFMHDQHAKIMNFAWPKEFIEQGKVTELKQKFELDCNTITERIIEYFERKA